MQRFNVVSSEATVIDCVRADLFRVALSNGHQLMAHVESASGASSFDASQCLPGSRVLVQLRAFDPSRGTVLEVLMS